MNGKERQMSPETIDAIVAADLMHIDKAPPGTPQRMLSGAYADTCKHYLKGAASRPRGEIFQEAIEMVRLQNPDFQAEYDREYFSE
jgi:hypothetical protein